MSSPGTSIADALGGDPVRQFDAQSSLKLSMAAPQAFATGPSAGLTETFDPGWQNVIKPELT